MFWFKKQKIKPYDSGYFYEGKEKDWNNLTDDKLTYAIEESRLYLQSIFDSNASLSQKAMFLLTLIMGFIVYIFLEFITKYKQHNIDSLLFYLIASYFCILILSFILLYRFVLPTIDIYSVGNAPENLLIKKGIMDYGFKQMIVSQLENYQDRITHNTKQNLNKAKYIKWSIGLIIGYPITVTIVLFITYLFYLL